MSTCLCFRNMDTLTMLFLSVLEVAQVFKVKTMNCKQILSCREYDCKECSGL